MSMTIRIVPGKDRDSPPLDEEMLNRLAKSVPGEIPQPTTATVIEIELDEEVKKHLQALGTPVGPRINDLLRKALGLGK